MQPIKSHVKCHHLEKTEKFYEISNGHKSESIEKHSWFEFFDFFRITKPSSEKYFKNSLFIRGKEIE